MTPEKLREIYGAPTARAKGKVISHFDNHCRQFIAHSSFVVIATSDGFDLDVSPKGDPSGFASVEDDHKLLVPDRPGNNRIDGLMNILVNPKVALLFMIPTVAETLRVNGQATIIDDPEVCNRFQINGRNPKTVLEITADEIYIHCGKALVRAGLWKPDTWHGTRPVPTLNEIVRDHAQIPVESTDQASVEKSYQKTLY